MATINGYTAEKMKEIADSAFKAAAIVGDNLVITHQDDTTTVVGNVRGPQGDPGISDMVLYDPVGVPKPLLVSAIPTGYGLCDGTTEYDAATSPILAAEWGTGPACVNKVCAVGKIALPDLRGMTIFGLKAGVSAFDTLMETGGSKDAVVVQHNHAHDHAGNTDAAGDPHTHEFEHTHGAEASSGVGNQIALINNTANVQSGADYQAITGYTGGTTSPSPDAITGPASDSSHPHSFTTDEDSTNAGVSGVDKNLPPYRVANWIMRLA